MPPRRGKPWKQPKPAMSDTETLLKRLDATYPDARLFERLVETRIEEAWRDSVGDSLARRSNPLRFERAGTLHVIVESSTWMNELVYMEKDILAKVNAAYRARVPDASPTAAPVKRLKLHVGVVKEKHRRPAPEPAPPPTTDELREAKLRAAEIADPELREAARKLILKAARHDRDRDGR